MHYLARIDIDDERDVFRADRQIDGWRYAYLRSVEKSRRRLLRGNRPFDLTLYVVEADRRRRYVAHIAGVECLGVAQAAAARAALARGGECTAGEADIALNVRFRLDDLRRCSWHAYAASDDPVMTYHRYQLHGADARAAPPPQRSPEYAAMHRRLVAQLRAAHPDAALETEAADADVLLRREGTTYAFQIRTELDPRTALCRALDRAIRQWLDSLVDAHATRLVVVVRAEPDAADLRYLSLLRGMLGLPIVCRVVAAEPIE